MSKKETPNWKERIPHTQYGEGILTWAGRLKWEPDSSPKAWEHYKKYYTDHRKSYRIDNPIFFRYLGPKTYAPIPQPRDNRLYALINDAKPDPNGYYKACPRLSGDVDFNFGNEKYKRNQKYKKYLNYIKKETSDKKTKEEAKELLEECRSMHHSLLNFSLMQSMGKLQGFKGEGLCLTPEKAYKDRKPKDYEYNDRLDTFVYYLDAYYKVENKEESEIVKRQRARGLYTENVNALIGYLDTFSEGIESPSRVIYNYCEKIYFIEDKAFIDKLIESGSERIDSIDKLMKYMKLAKEFWQKKQEYFEKRDKETDMSQK